MTESLEQPTRHLSTRAEPAAPFEVKENRIGDIAVRTLGPVTLWGGEVSISKGDITRFKEAVATLAKETGFRYSGYFIDNGNAVTFHLSRLPRRVGIEVPEVTQYQSSLNSLSNYLECVGIAAEVTEENLHASPRMRAIFGLQEGYYEPRKQEMVTKIQEGTITTLNEAKAAIEKAGLDLERFGIDINSFASLRQLEERLSSTSFTTEHSPAAARAMLAPEFDVKSVLVYAVGRESTYSEPSIRVEAPTKENFFEQLVEVGNAFRQARFSLEYLDQGTANNVELLTFSTNKAATAT